MLKNIQSVLIGLTEEGEDAQKASSALAYGLSLAREARAHVTVQAASLKLVMTHAFVSSVAAGLAAAENRRLDALASAAADTARREAMASGLTCTVETLQLPYQELVKSFTALARTHDLTILDAEPVALAADRGLIEAVLTDSGRPLLTVPPGWQDFRVARVVVAWDGSAKAARALNDALPFLRTAENVDLISVTGEKDLADIVPGSEIAPHLTRHGVNVTAMSLPALEGDAAETLRNHATLTRADLIVMGAFVHSRLLQMVLGGVTQSMLRHCPVPLLLSY